MSENVYAMLVSDHEIAILKRQLAEVHAERDSLFDALGEKDGPEEATFARKWLEAETALAASQEREKVWSDAVAAGRTRRETLEAEIAALRRQLAEAKAQTECRTEERDAAEETLDQICDILGLDDDSDPAPAMVAALHARVKTLEAALDGSRPLPTDRDNLGRLVREAWVRWAQQQLNPKASWLVPWSERSEPDREADQIGRASCRERVYVLV